MTPRAGMADQEESDFSLRKMRIAGVALIGGLFGSSMLPYGALMFAMLPMTQEFDWTRTEFSWATTTLMWAGALSLPFMGRAIDRLGVRPVILGGTAVVGLITLALAHLGPNPWIFWALFAVLGAVGCSAIGYTKVTAALFTRHRGKALAVFGAESALVASVAPLLTNFLMQSYGWRGVFTVYGFIILAVLPLIFFLLPEPDARPGDPAWKRRAPAANALQHAAAAANVPGLTAHEALRDRVFWTLVVASICAMAPASGMVNHMVAAVVEKGFTQTLAANLASVAMVCGVAWTLLGGYLVDKVPTARINIPFQLLSAFGVLLFSLVTPAFGGVALLLVAYNLQGLGLTAGRPMSTYFHSRFFGFRAFGEITALQTVPLTIGMGLSAPLMGWIYDTTHSYQIAFTIMIAGLLISAGLYMTLGRYRFSVSPAAIEPILDAEEVIPPAAPVIPGQAAILAGAAPAA